MKFASMFLVGWAVFCIGVAAALWKLGILQSIGAGWTVIGIVIAIGVGIMISMGGGRQSVEIDRS